jgi:membrane protease YdiL (CAAX protease family)
MDSSAASVVIILLAILGALVVDFVLLALWMQDRANISQFSAAAQPPMPVEPQETASPEEALPGTEPLPETVSETAEDLVLEEMPDSSEPVAESQPLDLAEPAVPKMPPLFVGMDPETPPVPTQAPPRRYISATWSLTHPWFICQAGIIMAGALQVVMLASLGAGAAASLTSAYGVVVLIIGILLQNTFFVTLTQKALLSYGSSLKEVGLVKPTRSQIAEGVAYGTALFIVGALLRAVLFSLLTLLSKSTTTKLQDITDGMTAGGIFEKLHSPGLMLAFAVIGCTAAPIGEEILFRGLLYNCFKRRLGVKAAIGLSALCFAAIHFGPLAVISIIPIGLVLAYVYEKTRNLWVTITIHAVNNAGAFALMLIAHK